MPSTPHFGCTTHLHLTSFTVGNRPIVHCYHKPFFTAENKRGRTEQWNCAACTFVNTAGEHCTVCGTAQKLQASGQATAPAPSGKDMLTTVLSAFWMEPPPMCMPHALKTPLSLCKLMHPFCNIEKVPQLKWRGTGMHAISP